MIYLQIPPQKKVCTKCETIASPKLITKGSLAIEIILWLCFIVPGLIYTLWRLTSGQYRACPSCGSPDIVPLDSPVGQRITQKAIMLNDDENHEVES